MITDLPNLAVRWCDNRAYLESSAGDQLASTQDSAVAKMLERVAQGYNIASGLLDDNKRQREQIAELRAALERLELSVASDPEHEEGIPFHYRGAVEQARAALAKSNN
jgi:hypothetical protein